jgi:DNA repair photolyase
MHNCSYCDGRCEKYQVKGEFGKNVHVKINALELLKKEMSIQRRRKFYQNGFIMVGGGIGDNYQHVEKKYKLTQKILELLASFRLPVHILTKSTLVERDIGILENINENSKALISFSFSSTNDELSKILEPGVPPPSKRLETIRILKEKGFSCGIFLLPVVPFITDTIEIMKQSIEDAYIAEVDFIIFGGMTLKSGNQKSYFYQHLKEYFPDLLPSYEIIYKGNKWGNAIDSYYQSIEKTFNILMKKYHIPKRIPSVTFKDIVSENDLVSIILDHLHYLVKLQGKKSPYGFASYTISQLQHNLSDMKDNLQSIKGVGRVTEKIILEILKKKTSSYYEKLLIN